MGYKAILRHYYKGASKMCIRDSTTTEPTLLPVTFPTILANNTLGIAVGMACNICSFNLAELCATTVALMKDPHHDIAATMPAPDFVGGGQILSLIHI